VEIRRAYGVVGVKWSSAGDCFCNASSCDCLQAQHNTRLLQSYADIDERVRTLGYIMKVFAKVAPSQSLYSAA